MKHKRDFWWESVSFVFLCYCTWGWSTTRPCSGQHLKENCFWKENYSDKKKTNREMKTVEKTVYSPLYFNIWFFSVGVRGCRSQLKPTARWWELAAEPFWSLTHFPPPFPPFSLCLLLFLGLSLSHSNLSHSQSVSPLFLPVHFVIPNRTLPKE